MAARKLGKGLLDTVARAGAEEVVTALVRPRAAGPDRAAVARIRSLADGERLATRPSELLRLVTERYGRGRSFRANLQSELQEVWAKVAGAAPYASVLWLARAVAVAGTRAELRELARHEEVARIEANPVFGVSRVPHTPVEPGPAADGVAWGVARIGAPAVWEGFGRGGGLLIGHVDTGIDDGHPALAGRVAAFQEFDALGMPVVSIPHDSDTHGTHTAGVLAGGTARGTRIGVAPDALLVSALALPGGSGTFAQIVAGAQWAVEQGADVVSMAHASGRHPDMWRLPLLNLTLSGVVPVAPVGDCGHGASRCPGNDLSGIGVGATDPHDTIAAFSGGQLLSVPWSGAPATYSKPDVSAPGVGIPSAAPGGALVAASGTSLAAAHVAGAVALLQSAVPALRGDPFATRAVLLAAVRARGEAGRDQRFGFGRVDARSSVRRAVAFT